MMKGKGGWDRARPTRRGHVHVGGKVRLREALEVLLSKLQQRLEQRLALRGQVREVLRDVPLRHRCNTDMMCQHFLPPQNQAVHCIAVLFSDSLE